MARFLKAKTNSRATNIFVRCSAVRLDRTRRSPSPLRTRPRGPQPGCRLSSLCRPACRSAHRLFTGSNNGTDESLILTAFFARLPPVAADGRACLKTPKDFPLAPHDEKISAHDVRTPWCTLESPEDWCARYFPCKTEGRRFCIHELRILSGRAAASRFPP